VRDAIPCTPPNYAPLMLRCLPCLLTRPHEPGRRMEKNRLSRVARPSRLREETLARLAESVSVGRIPLQPNGFEPFWWRIGLTVAPCDPGSDSRMVELRARCGPQKAAGDGWPETAREKTKETPASRLSWRGRPQC